MAFAATAYQRLPGNRMRGTWTATAGDAAGTITFDKPPVSAVFYDNLTTAPRDGVVNITGWGTTTLTIYPLATATDGYFEIQLG